MLRDAGQAEQDRPRLAQSAQEGGAPRGQRHEYEQGDREPADREDGGGAGLERPAGDDVRGGPEDDREADGPQGQRAVRHPLQLGAVVVGVIEADMPAPP